MITSWYSKPCRQIELLLSCSFSGYMRRSFVSSCNNLYLYWAYTGRNFIPHNRIKNADQYDNPKVA